mmetsp:Transcript_31913/g.43576  ORF Transcript_31913/g.43576 Transcript_31913/m.43576 type:complete len:106 (-) Transcript_31913:158-475(-)
MTKFHNNAATTRQPSAMPSTFNPSLSPSAGPSIYPTLSPSVYSSFAPTAKERSNGVAAGLIVGAFMIIGIALFGLAFVRERKTLKQGKSSSGFNQLDDNVEDPQS